MEATCCLRNLKLHFTALTLEGARMFKSLTCKIIWMDNCLLSGSSCYGLSSFSWWFYPWQDKGSFRELASGSWFISSVSSWLHVSEACRNVYLESFSWAAGSLQRLKKMFGFRWKQEWCCWFYLVLLKFLCAVPPCRPGRSSETTSANVSSHTHTFLHQYTLILTSDFDLAHLFPLIDLCDWLHWELEGVVTSLPVFQLLSLIRRAWRSRALRHVWTTFTVSIEVGVSQVGILCSG